MKERDREDIRRETFTLLCCNQRSSEICLEWSNIIQPEMLPVAPGIMFSENAHISPSALNFFSAHEMIIESLIYFDYLAIAAWITGFIKQV